ncbi:MAG: prefoldin subunit alpha [Candidatus Woesearchaeota archaeon]
MENKEKVLQEKYIRYQIIRGQIADLEKQVRSLTGHIAELESSEDAIEQLKALPHDAEILVPITSGVFIKAKFVKEDALMVNSGAGVAVVKTIEDTKKILKEQRIELQEYMRTKAVQMQKLLNTADRIEDELRDMLKNNDQGE